jgi:hypothetical protein
LLCFSEVFPIVLIAAPISFSFPFKPFDEQTFFSPVAWWHHQTQNDVWWMMGFVLT